MAGKKKERLVRRRINVNPKTGEDIKSLVAFSRTEEGRELGLFESADGQGGTFGKGLSSFEQEGEGLPEGCGDEMSIDFRVVIEDGGAVELQVARKGSGRHARLRIEGLPDPSIPVIKNGKKRYENRQVSGVNNFLVNLDTSLTFYSGLLLKAYLARKDSLKRRRSLYDRVMRDIDIRFKSLLYYDPAKVKEVDRQSVGGIEIVTTVQTKGGRTKGTKGTRKASVKEMTRKEQYLKEISQAIRELDASGGNLDKKSVIAKHLGLPYSTFLGRLKTAGLSERGKLEKLIRNLTRD